MNAPHGLIIGAGFAGSTAAVRLVEAGWRVTLMDARGVGGRVYSLEDRETGDIIDNGQHLLMGCYHRTLHVLNVLGTTHLLRPQAAMRVEFVEAGHVPSATISTLDASLLPGKLGMALGILGLGGLTLADKLRALQFVAALQLGMVRAEGFTTLELLRRHKQPENLIRRLWEPIVLATLNAPLEQAAASLLVEVFKRAFFADTASSRLLLPRTGLDEVLKPLPAWLQARGSRFVRASAAHILSDESSNAIRGVQTSTGEVFQADCVISAVPPNNLLKLLPEQWKTHPFFDPLNHYHFSPIVSVYLWFDRPVLNELQSEFAAMLGTTTQWVFNRRAMVDTYTTPQVVARFPGHLSLTVSASNDLVNEPHDRIVAVCLDELRAAFPSVGAARLLRGRVIKEKRATPLITPNQESMRLTAQTPIHGLVLAGDWTDTKLPATIEGASQSGSEAASRLLQMYSQKRILIAP
jgi:squalene-associated FAD-dependent desaturase